MEKMLNTSNLILTDKKKEQPLDAKLLSDSVIELNISRRSVGLYPSDHPITRESIKNAYDSLKKLFEIRCNITLGVAKDVLMVDEYMLDKKNPVYNEFASALHMRGIASITFYSGLEEKDLLLLHEIITNEDDLRGQELLDLKQYKKIKHIRLILLDVSKFKFIESTVKKDEQSGQGLWEDYVYGLLEGKLADSNTDGVLLNIPPDDLATIINSYPSTTDEGYDRVITKYLSEKDRKDLTRNSLNRFVSLVENLNPHIKKQFLLQAKKHHLFNKKGTEECLRELTPDEIERLMKVFQNKIALPKSLGNFIDKLSKDEINQKNIGHKVELRSRLDDVELSKDILELFNEDNFIDYIDNEYQATLNKVISSEKITFSTIKIKYKDDFSHTTVDEYLTDIILELISFENKEHDDHMKLIDKIEELTNMFLETGRLDQLYHIYNTVNSHLIEGKFRDENVKMVQSFFHTEENIFKIIDAFKIWGREQRDAVFQLSKIYKRKVIPAMLDALIEENRASQRKFYLSILISLGNDTLKEAIKLLDDKRWYVVRNMMYLIRECGGEKYLYKIRPLSKSKNKRICVEALNTLFHFSAPDAFSRLRPLLLGNNPYLREQAIKLCDKYRIKEAIPYLLEILKKQLTLCTDPYSVGLVISALSKTGNSVSIDTLKGFFTSKAILYKNFLREIRLQIIANLKNYPLEEVVPILEIAVKSDDDEIKTQAKRLLSRGINA